MKFELVFGNGRVYNGYSQVYLCPLNYFLTFINIIVDHEDESTCRKMFYDSMKKDAFVFFKYQEKFKLPLTQRINSSVDYINSLGFGEIKLKSVKSEKIVFLFDRLYLSNSYKSIFKNNSKLLVEEIIVGFLLNYLKYLYGSKIEVKLKNLNLNKYAEFEFSVGEKIETEKFDINYMSFDSGKVDQLLKKVILNKDIVVERGILKVWSAHAVLVPYFFLIELSKFMVSDYYRRALYHLSLLQGRASVEMHRKMFGIKTSEKLFWQVINISGISGLGKYEFPNKEPKECLYDSVLFDFEDYYSLEELQILLTHFISIWRGVYEFSYETFTDIEIIDKRNYVLKELDQERILNEYEEKLWISLTTKVLVKNSL